MRMKNGENIKKELTSQFKTDMRNVTNFDSRTQKTRALKNLKNLPFNGLPLSKVYNV